MVDESRLWSAGEEPPRIARSDCAGILETMDETWTAMLWAILPTLVVSVVFFFILRNVIRMDRTERKVYSRIEAEERAKRGLPPVARSGEGPAA